EEALRYFGPCFYEFYGSTELGINTVLRPEGVLRKPGSCGRAAPGIDIALLADGGNPVPGGEPGGLYVRRFGGMYEAYYTSPPTSCAPSPASTWPTTRCRARSRSPRTFRATAPASSSSGCSATPTGRGTAGRSDGAQDPCSASTLKAGTGLEKPFSVRLPRSS